MVWLSLWKNYLLLFGWSTRVHVSEWKQYEAPFKMVDQLSNITNGTANVSKYYQTKLFFWKPRTFWRPVAFQQVYNGKGIIRIVNNSEICKVIVETKLASSCFCLPIFYILLLAWPSQDVFLLPHIPWIGQGGSILLVLYALIVLMACHFMNFVYLWAWA